MAVRITAASLALTIASVIATTGGAHALTMKECSAKYKAAQQAGTLKGMKWNDFRKAEYGTDATAMPTAAPAGTTTPAAPKAEKKEAVRPAPPAPAAPAPAATGNAIFP